MSATMRRLKRFGCRASSLGLAALIAAALFCGRLEAAEQEPFTLRVPTEDGLVVAVGSEEAVRAAFERLGRKMKGKSGISALEVKFALLEQPQEGLDFVNVYFTREAVEKFLKTNTLKTTVKKAELEGMIPLIEDMDLFEAWLMLKAEGAEVKILEGEEGVPKGEEKWPFPIFALSSTNGHGEHAIFVNGESLSPDSVGYNVAAFDAQGKTIAARGFDTKFGANGPQEAADLYQFLQGLPDDAFVAIGTLHGHGVFISGGIMAAFQRFGGSIDLNPELDRSHALIGHAGWAPGEAAEEAHVADRTRLARFGAGSYISGEELDALTLRKGGILVVLTGTEPDSDIYIVQ